MNRNLVRNVRSKLAISALMLISVCGVLAQYETSEFNQSENDVEFSNHGRYWTLEGTWDTRVSIRNCQNGTEIRAFDSIGTFARGGTMMDSTSGIPQTLKTPGHGVWKRLQDRRFRFAFKSFAFDASGNYTGYQVIDHIAVMNQRGDRYTSTGTAKFYNPAGVPIMQGCSSTTALRFPLGYKQNDDLEGNSDTESKEDLPR